MNEVDKKKITVTLAIRTQGANIGIRNTVGLMTDSFINMVSIITLFTEWSAITFHTIWSTIY